MNEAKTNKLKNVVFNGTYYLLNTFFPLIIFPYVSRTLGVEGIGSANLAITVATYFTTIASLGIPIYGVREVAKRRDQKESLNKLVSELMLLNFIGVVISFIAFYFVISLFEVMRENYVLYLIASINIALSFFQIDWLFQGMENFKILALRNAIVKIVSIILVFSMVHNGDNVPEYVLVTTIALSFTNIFNIYHAVKVINFTFFGLSIAKHIKPTLYFLSTRVVSTIYTLLDSIILGVLVNSYAVGLYSIAIKLVRTMTSLVSSVSIVYFSDSSILVETNNDRYQKLLADLFALLLIISMPIVTFTFVYSAELIVLFAGRDFKDASVTLMIISPLVFISTVTSFLGIQILYSNGKERVVAISLLIGAIVSVIINVTLIPVIEHNGAAIAVVAAELSVLLYQLFNIVVMRLDLTFMLNRRVVNIAYVNCIYLAVIFLFKNIFVFDSDIKLLLLSVGLSAVTYPLLLILFKDSIVLVIKERITR